MVINPVIPFHRLYVFPQGDPTRDAFAPRYFVEQGHQIALCQSFAKVTTKKREAKVDDIEHIAEHGSIRRACRRLLSGH